MSETDVIAAYQEAYFAANGEKARIEYVNGWCRIGWSAFRQNQVEQMTAILRERARASAPGRAPEEESTSG